MNTESIRDLYAPDYTAAYRELYIDHTVWRAKHQHNLETLQLLLTPTGSWLDLCCGQAWHFTRFPDHPNRLGVDLSMAQLAVARQHNPGANFALGDVRTFQLQEARRFQTVTLFWGAYGYLDDWASIEQLVDKMVDWVLPGGHLYIELIIPQLLMAFNEATFAAETKTKVFARSDDLVQWGYMDPGGTHLLTSPPPFWFYKKLYPHFEEVDMEVTLTAIRQLKARCRRSP